MHTAHNLLVDLPPLQDLFISILGALFPWLRWGLFTQTVDTVANCSSSLDTALYH